MARILCVTSGLTSILHSSLELARRLARTGHDVTFASPPEVAAMVERQGLTCVPLEPNRYPAFLATDRKASLVRRVTAVRARREAARNAMAVGSFATTVRAVHPDLILIDAEMHEQIITASGAGVPLALLVAFVSIWKRPGLPPPHTFVRPGHGWRGTPFGMTSLWLALRFRRWRRRWGQRVRDLGCDRVSVLRSLAQDVGFDFRRETDYGQWLIPFTYTRRPALTLHALEIDFPHAPRSGVYHLGPMALEPSTDPRVTPDVRRRLDALFRRRRTGTGRKLIYAGFGSFFTADDALLRRFLEAVAAREGWDVVVSLGGQEVPGSLLSPPSNVEVLPWVPQLEVLRHTDVAVIHGGIGTVDECVLAGVPMLVYWGFETDLPGTAARVWHHDLGIVGDPRDDSDVIRGRIEELLSQPRFKDNVTRMRTRQSRYADDQIAERTIESLLGS